MISNLRLEIQLSFLIFEVSKKALPINLSNFFWGDHDKFTGAETPNV